MEATDLLRAIAAGVFLLDLAISAHYRRKAETGSGTNRPRRGEEPVGLRLGRIFVAGPLFVGFLVWLVRPSWMAWAALELPSPLRWLGAGLLIATVPLTWWVMRHLGGGVTETVLVAERSELSTTGPYRWVRHPLYTTSLVLWIGASLAAANLLLGFFTLLLGGLYLLLVVPDEERALLREHGAVYRAYRERTGRLLPRLRGRGRPPGIRT